MNSPAAGSVTAALQGHATVAPPMRLHPAALQALVEALQQHAANGALGGMLLYRAPGREVVVITPDEQAPRTEREPWPATGADEWFLIVTGADYPLVLCGAQSEPAGDLTVQCSTEPRVAGQVADLVLRSVAGAETDQPALPRTAPSPAGACHSLVVMLLERLDTAHRRSVTADAEILGAVAAERRRAAAALHDGPVQELTAALLFLDGATLGAGAIDGDLVRRGSDALRSAVMSCRAMMDDLSRPLPGQPNPGSTHDDDVAGGAGDP